MENSDRAKVIAENLYQWMTQQTYGDEALLHPAVCCDFVGMARFKSELEEIVLKNLNNG